MELFGGEEAAPLIVSPKDFPGARKAVGDLRLDLERVSGTAPAVLDAPSPGGLRAAVIIGTLGGSPLVDALAERGAIDAGAIRGRWEAFSFRTVEKPFPGIERALVIAGSDARGTIYGVYELSRQIGVSPWHWWADSAPERRKELHVPPVDVADKGPAVKYRGIFLNDEEPCLGPWARETFGGLNAAFYSKVFELILRLRGNYLWPAMWSKSLAEDDPASLALAAERGIVLGTSHHEPLMRAHVDWARGGKGPWNYRKNGEFLRGFWREGVKRTAGIERIVTIGMRGDGDEPMSEEDDVALLERIVADQRTLIAEETGAPSEATPQVWALYKEVQGYYERGMRVPEDVTLLWCDDNWGNIRRLPTAEERTRPGGAGIYYHFDYVGGPRCYKWMNSSTIERTWEQMRRAYDYGATRLWVVNVGDLKPLEYPLEFFLAYAWAPEAIGARDLMPYARSWAVREFGEEHGDEIAAIMAAYPKLNMRRKPELLGPETYSVVDYREAETAAAEWEKLESRARAVLDRLPTAKRAAFRQLVHHPVKASAVLHALHRAVALNRFYALQGRTSANTMAERARSLFQEDEELERLFHEELSEGKWRHMMAQPHIGYYYWNYPARNIMPAVHEVRPTERGELAVSIEGQERSWPDWWQNRASLPPFNPFDLKVRWLEIFNRGLGPVDFTVEADEPWIILSRASGRLGKDARIEVGVDWSRVPAGASKAVIAIKGSDGASVEVDAPLEWAEGDRRAAPGRFMETLGCLSIEAEHYAAASAPPGREWKLIPNFGRTLSGMAAFPSLAPPAPAGKDGMGLEFRVRTRSAGKALVRALFAPALPYAPGGGFRFALSVDEGLPLTVNAHADQSEAAWAKMVSDEILEASAELDFGAPGDHALRYWAIDSGLVLEKIVADFGGMRPSYLYPPESFRA
jgi:hypothetical protein